MLSFVTGIMTTADLGPYLTWLTGVGLPYVIQFEVGAAPGCTTAVVAVHDTTTARPALLVQLLSRSAAYAYTRHGMLAM
jgi:hypothetical protein